MKLWYTLFLIFSTLLCNINAFSQSHELYGIWARRAPFGSAGSAEISSSITDEAGNVYVTGIFTGKLNFSDDLCNPVMSELPASAGKGIFLLKLDKNGKYQWHIVYEITQGTYDPPLNNLAATIYDYKDGKLMFYGRLNYLGTMSTIGMKSTLYRNNFVGTPESHTKSTSVSYDNRYSYQFLHIVNTNNGTTNLFLDPFDSQIHNLAAKFQGNNINTVHMGWDDGYPNNESLVSTYDGTTGALIGSNTAYPDQPYASPGNSGCGSTVVRHVTLTNGRQVMIHNSYGKVGDIDNVPSYYLLYYSANYGAKQQQYLMSQRAIEVFPLLTTDNSNNIYLATNYGRSKYWDSYNYADPDIPNSNHLDNYLGTGNNYITAPQRNKVVLAQMDNNNVVKWMFEIGAGKNVNDETEIIAYDMKTIGRYTYMVGVFEGYNIDFNGITLSNHGATSDRNSWNSDVFYAVFDNENYGNCVYAVNMGHWGYDKGSALYLSSDASQVIIGGSYTSNTFQTDPAGRLYELTSNGQNEHGYVAKYSTDPDSEPAQYPSSFGDGPATYGVAVHHIYECINLGNIPSDMNQLQSAPNHSRDANTAYNDNGIDINAIKTPDGYIDLTHADFYMNPTTGDLEVKVKVRNLAPTQDSAKVVGWIDFNQNGTYDGYSEASSLEVIPYGTNGTVTLRWVDANRKLRNTIINNDTFRTTYMRIRITTDHMDGAQPTGLFFNGEVEDYRVDFKVSEVVKSLLTAGPVNLGDTLEYKVVVKNYLPAPLEDVLVFDPVQGFVTYVAGSATADNVPVGGTQPQLVPERPWEPASVVWARNATIAANGTSPEYRFKAVVADMPNGNWGCNAAFAIAASEEHLGSFDRNGDWHCIEVKNLWAYPDYFAVLKNTTIAAANIGANDFNPTRTLVVDAIITAPQQGTAMLNEPRDGTLRYTPNTGFLGVDVLDYRITGGTSGTMTADSRAYFAVVTPVSDNYVTCSGTTISLGMLPNDNSRITYEWYNGGGTKFATGAEIPVNIAKNDTTLYVQVLIDGNAATPRFPISVTVNPSPVVSITGNQAICVDATTQLTGTPANGGGNVGVWSSSNTAVATVNASGLVTGASAGTAIIKYTVTNSSGCIDSAKVTITINAKPVVSISGNQTICVDETTQLTGSPVNGGGNVGVWSSSNIGVATVNGSGLVTGANAGTTVIKYVVTNGSGCIDSAKVTITVNAKPVVNITGNQTICVDETTQLTGSPTGGIWTSLNPSVATISNGLVTGKSAGTATIRYVVTNSSGCIDSAKVTITVNAKPVVSISGNQTICVDETSQLTGSPTGGIWTSLNPSVATISNGLVTGKSAGTAVIRYVVTNGSGCIDSAKVTITVNAKPVVNISGNQTICVDETTQLIGTPFANGVWTSLNPAVATISNGLVTGKSAGTAVIRYVVTNSSGCIDSAKVTITVNAKPVVSISGNQTICVDETTQLTGSPSTGGIWTSLNPSVATISNGLVTGKSAGTTVIKYTVTNSSGCIDSAKVTITVNAKPVVSISGNQTICVDETTQLTGSPSTGGTWTSLNPSVATISNGLVTGKSAGTTIIKYTVTNSSGCIDSAKVTITVNAKPVVSISGNQTICVDETSQLTGSPTGGIWTSLNPSVATISNGLVTGKSSGTAVIRYVVTNGSGCIDSAKVTITVNAKPVVSITGNQTICVDETTQLTGTPSTNGVWTSLNPAVATISNGLVTGKSSGTAVIRYVVTNGSGCIDSAKVTITVNAKPVVSISGNQTVCVDETTQLTGTPSTNDVWTSLNPSVATISNGLVTGVSTGTATIRYVVTNGSGCIDSAKVTITVNAKPVVSITGNQTICVDETTQLTGSPTANGVWTSLNPAVATISNGLVTGKSSGTTVIKYAVTNGSGCIDSAKVTITVNAKPIVSITGNQTICVDETTQLTGSPANGGGNIGVWSSSNTGVATVNGSGLVTGANAGTAVIKYAVTNGSGCIDSAKVTITVNAKPLVSITGNQTICVDETTQLTGSPANGSGNVGVWSSSNTGVATISNGLVTGVSAGTATIKYTVTNGSGCIDSAKVTVTVNAKPVVSITGNQTICVDETTQLTGTPSTNGVWTSLNPSVVTISNGLVTGVSAGTATIRYVVTNGSGCIDSAKVTVTVNAKPVVSISGNQTICVDETTQLTGTPSTGGIWTSLNPGVATISNGLVTGVSAGTATIRYVVTNSSGCIDSAKVTITVNAKPIVSITGNQTICVDETTQLTGTPSTNGIWTSLNPAVATINNGLVTGVSSGTATIRYVVTNSSGCIDSAKITITVNAKPVVSISGNQTICVDETTQLTGTPSTNGVWTSLNPAVATISNGLVTGKSAGTAVIRYVITNSSGCIDSAKVTITVNAKPVVSIAGNQTICVDETTQLTSSPTGGIWASLNPSVATISNGLVTGVSSGTAVIKYTVTNSSGCIDSAKVTITVNAKPVVNISGNQTICVDETTQLIGTPSTNGVWTSLNPSVATISNGLVTGVSPGTAVIRYVVTNGSGCIDSAKVTITVNAKPVVSITGNQTICVDETTQLTGSPVNGSGNVGVWSSSNTAVATINGSGLVTGANAGTAVIKYAVTNGSGCIDSAKVTITVNAKPVVSITGNQTICVDEATQLTGTPSTGGIWTSLNPGVATISNGLITGVNAGTAVIRYVVTNGSGCVDSAKVTITVNAKPVVSIIGNQTICVDETTQLTGSPSTNGVWTSLNPSVATISNGLVTGVSAGTAVIRYVVTNGSGCIDSAKVTITVNAKPVVSITGNQTICVDETTQLTGSPSANGVWTSLNPSVATISNGLVTGISSGTAVIKYTVTNSSGCIDSAKVTITVNAKPVVSITGNQTICVDETTQLTGTPSTNGIWTSLNPSVATISNGLVTGVSVGTAVIRYVVTNGSGCIDSAKVTITVNAKPVVSITGNQTICVDETTQLIGTPSTNGVWTSLNPSVATISNGLVTGVSSGTAVIRYVVTNGSGCIDSAKVTITVNAKPVVSITGNQTICVDETSQLTGTPSTNGIWSGSNTGVATVNGSGLVTGASSGTAVIKYTVTNGSGCIDSAKVTITVNAKPVVSITGNQTICVDETTQLTGNPTGGIWTSLNPSVATISNGLVTGKSSGTAVIRYVVTNGSGCIDSAKVTITVNAKPIVNITGNQTICVDETTQLTGSPSAGGTWTSLNPAVATISNGLVTGVNVGTAVIKYTVTNGSGCIDSAKVTITVNAKPVVSITGNQTICVDETTQLTGTPSTNGVWTSLNPSVATINNGLVIGVSAGTATIRYVVTNSSGCIDSAKVTITVNAKPVVSITGNQTICVDETTQLTGTPSTNGIWTSLNPSVATISNGLVTGISSGTAVIKYTVTNGSGCIDSAKVTITVNAKPVVSISGNQTICVDETTQLTGSPSANGVWTSLNPSVATISNGLVTGVNAGTAVIKYTVTNSSGCIDSAKVTITVNAKPVVSITGNQTICVDETAQLTGTPSTGGIWTSLNPSVATISNGLVTGKSAGTAVIRYVVTNGSGCIDSAKVTITVNAKPVVNISGNQTICVDETTQLTGSPSTGGVWTSLNPAVATISNGLVTGKSSGTATIRYVVTNGSGCIDSAKVTVTVNAKPVVSITGNQTICVDETTQLTGSPVNGSGNVGVWSSSNTAVATINGSGLVTGANAGTAVIKYVVTNGSGCIDSAKVTITVNAKPVVSITGNQTICVDETTQLTGAPSTNGIWTSLNPGVATISNGLVTGVSAGTAVIRYVVTNGSGCIDSAKVTITVNAKPVVSITGNQTICVDETTQLTGSPSANGVWTSLNPSVATISNGLVTGISSGTAVIKYTVTNGSGCIDSAKVTITVNDKPSVSITGNQTICVDETTQLIGSPTGGIWTSLNSAIATISDGLVTGISSGTVVIKYVVTNSSGCIDSAKVTITVNAKPSVSISGDQTICLGGTAQLTGMPSGGIWSSLTPSVATVSSDGLVTASNAGTTVIRYVVTNASGCTDSADVNITVEAYPVVSEIVGADQVCPDQYIVLSNETIGGVWSTSDESIAIVNSSTNNPTAVTGVSEGMATVSYTVGNVCKTSVTHSVKVLSDTPPKIIIGFGNN